MDGPYRLSDVVVERLDGGTGTRIEAHLAVMGDTEAYTADSFRPAEIVPGFVDADQVHSGERQVDVPVVLSDPVNVPVTVDVEAMALDGDGYAVPGEDFDVAESSITFLPGETTKHATVTLFANSELDEVTLAALGFSNAEGAVVGGFYGLGGVNIQPVPEVVPRFATVSQGDIVGSVEVDVEVTLSGPSEREVTVDYEALEQDGYAVPGEHFDVDAGTLSFAPGETSRMVTVTVYENADQAETLLALVGFSNPTNAVVGGFSGLGGVWIEPE